MDFKDLVQQRRSHRKFTGEEVSAEDVKTILRAGLMAPTSKGQRAWQFVVVDDKADLEKLSDAKDLGGQFLRDAALAIGLYVDGWQVAQLSLFARSAHPQGRRQKRSKEQGTYTN